MESFKILSKEDFNFSVTPPQLNSPDCLCVLFCSDGDSPLVYNWMSISRLMTGISFGLIQVSEQENIPLAIGYAGNKSGIIYSSPPNFNNLMNFVSKLIIDCNHHNSIISNSQTPSIGKFGFSSQD